MTQAREHQTEILSTALSAFHCAHGRVAGGELTAEAVTGEIRALNRLYDAALDCGMSMDEPTVEEWAAERVARWLVAA